MIDEKKLKDHLKWVGETEWCWDFPDTIYKKLWESIDDDRKGLEKVLAEMEPEDLVKISGLFDDFYEKWPDRKMAKFLEEQRLRISEAGLEL